MYKVIKYFTDLQDDSYAYDVGDIYPREGLTPTKKRISELCGSKNKQGVPLIEENAEEDTAEEENTEEATTEAEEEENTEAEEAQEVKEKKKIKKKGK